MLRRRHKNPKTHPKARAIAPAAPVVPGSRRRARADAPVPEHIKISQEAPLVLVTGFEPFGGEDTNASWEVCKLLPASIGSARIETLKVPCEFRRAIETVARAIERSNPAIVICIGQAAGRAQLSMERVGINIDDARAPDNAGSRPIDEPIAANGPSAYFATVPIKAMAGAARAAGVPAEVSNTAGTYVCNHLLYGVLHYLAASGLAARAGFIHVPYAERQVLDKPGAPSMPVATMARGIEAAIGAALENATDMKVSEGKET